MPSDYALFNYNQAHDVQYVSSLYLERQKVKECLKENCSDGTISQWSHKQLYDFLDKLGFTKIR